MSSSQNRLLGALAAHDLATLQPLFETVPLRIHQTIAEAGAPVSHVYFLEGGILSMLAQSPEDRIEVGMVGREGAVGAAAVFGASRHVFGVLCQGDGSATRISASALQEAAADKPGILVLLGKYLQFLTVQIGQTAYANASLNIEARLARWILMTDDRSDSRTLSMTHEFIAAMLGTRRPGVTTAVHVLEGAKMIQAERGTIRVLDRSRLEDLASDAYGLAEAEYEKLFEAGLE
jgi:CRP-like cAMP-binding protein